MSFSRSASGSFLNFDELVRRNLQEGDLIEVDRGTYNHWAFYAGQCDNGTHWCFHVTTTGDGDFEKKGALMSNGSKATAAIKKHKLKEILDDSDSKKPSLARVNNKIAEANKKKCMPRSIYCVIEWLENRKDELVPYNLKKLNCEHYVTTWKYGTGWSRQVEIAEIATFSTIVAASAAAIVGVGVLIAGIFKMSSGPNKYEDDDDDDD